MSAPFHMLEHLSHVVRRALVLGLLGLMLHCANAQTSAPVVVSTSLTFLVMAANTTSGNASRYDPEGMRIFKALKADIVAVQEFKYASTNGAGINTPDAFREMVNSAFGTNFSYFREPYTNANDIPNGIISRWPIVASNSWDDVQVSDRGFAWAKIALPGTNFLYVVSVHLHGNGGPSSRSIEATNLKALIQSNFPANAWIVVAGDFNTETRTETCLTTFKSYLSDSPIPNDGNLNGTPSPNTNEPRGKPYDYVLPSFGFATNQVPTVIGSRSHANGLVFDSEIYTPLSDVAPVQFGDSHVFNMQHMAVVKDFRISYTVTNQVAVPRPVIQLVSSNAFRWSGLSNLSYRVLSSSSLSNFTQTGTSTSTSTNYFFTNSAPLTNQRFFRVVWP